MTWMMLALFALGFVAFAVSRRASLSPPFPRSPPLSAGVEGARKLRRKTKAALDAATAMLR